jgi:MFS family permease
VKTFSIIWLGDLVSQVGSRLTEFALAVYVYDLTGSVTRFTLVALLAVMPSLLLTPFAGAWADRWSRRGMMMVSSAGGAVSTFAVLGLSATHLLQLWEVYAATAIISCFATLYVPAYAAVIPAVIPSQHLVRANGLTQLSQATAQIAAPLLAGFLVAWLGLNIVVLTDCATYVFGLGMLALVSIPKPSRSADAAASGSLLHEALYGFRYHARRPGLLALLGYFTVLNFFGGFANVLIVPLVLTFGSAAKLGTVLAAAGVGMIAGSAFLSVWGGPAHRIRAITGFGLLSGVGLIIGGLRPNVWLVAVAMFTFLFAAPIISGCSLAIWQTTTPADLQGRVLATRRLIARSTVPAAYLMAGPLADRIFNPLLTAKGVLAPSLGRVIGVGPGRGIGLLFIAMGICVLIAAIFAARHRTLRTLDAMPFADCIAFSRSTAPLESQ